MKKRIVIVLTLLAALASAACSNAFDISAAEPAAPRQGKKILIAYFTRSDNTFVKDPAAVNVDAASSASLLAPGNTAQMAAMIQSRVGGDLYAIKVKELYPEDYNECLERAADENSANARPELAGQVKDFQDYDVIFLGYPNWSYSCPMAVLSFLESYDFKGKTVIPFVSHGTGGLAASVRNLERSVPEARILLPLGIYRDDMPQAAARIDAWLQKLEY